MGPIAGPPADVDLEMQMRDAVRPTAVSHPPQKLSGLNTATVLQAGRIGQRGTACPIVGVGAVGQTAVVVEVDVEVVVAVISQSRALK